MASMSLRLKTLLPFSTSPFSILFSSLSITPHPPIPLFLLTECQFSPSQISKIMQSRKTLLKVKSPHTAREAVEFLKQCGFTQLHIHKTMLRYPGVLTCKVDTQLKPKFHFFRTLGFTDQELTNLISINPRVLGSNLESSIIRQISFLETLFGGKPNLMKALNRSPLLLTYSIEKQIKPKLDFFKQWGIEGQLLTFLLKSIPDILARYSIESLRVRMEYASNTMGIAQGSRIFVRAISVLLRIGPETVERKMKHLQCLGFLEDEVIEFLKKRPELLAYSTNKIQENLDFLTQTAGLKPNVVFSNSLLLKLSVTKRLKPRYEIFKALSAQQQFVPSLVTILYLSERIFLEKIVEGNPEASMLKEIYKGKMESADSESG